MESGSLREDEIQWAMIIHLSGISIFLLPLGNLLLPLIFWLVKRKGSRFVDKHGLEVLSAQIQITMMLLLIIFTLFYMNQFDISRTIELLLANISVVLVLYGVFAITFMVTIFRAATETSRGEHYRYPFILIRLYRVKPD